MKAKSKTFTEFKKLAKIVENIQKLTIKEIFSDGGGEFINQNFKNLKALQRINHIVSPPETPEHNGYAKQANHMILDKA